MLISCHVCMMRDILCELCQTSCLAKFGVSSASLPEAGSRDRRALAGACPPCPCDAHLRCQPAGGGSRDRRALAAYTGP